MTTKHTLLALLVVTIWGMNFVVIDAGLADVPPLVFLALRFLVVALPAVFFIKPPPIGWRNILAIGAVLSLGQFTLLYVALALGMPPGLASLLLQTQVLMTVGISALVLREKPTRRQLVGTIVGTGGLAVVIVGHSYAAPWLPIVVALASALAWSVGNVLARRAKAASGLSLVVWSGLVVPLPSLALAMVMDSPAVVLDSLVALSGTAILSTIYTAVASSLIGYGIWNSLLARYPTSAITPFTLLIPPVGIVSAWLVQGEAVTVTEFIGGVIMLAGLTAAVVVRNPFRGRLPRSGPPLSGLAPPASAAPAPAAPA